MRYALRQYDIDPAKWEEYRVWTETRALPLLLDQFGFRLLGLWQGIDKGGAQSGDAPPTTNLPWIRAWESEAEMRERWAAVLASPAWQAAWREAVDAETGELKYHRQTRSTLLRLLPASPLQ